jgi:hypothetical protein
LPLPKSRIPVVMGSGELHAGDTGGRYVASYNPEGVPGLSLYPSQGQMTIQSVRTTFHATSMANTIRIVRIVNFLQNVRCAPTGAVEGMLE